MKGHYCDNQGTREKTPQDDDGFESLNGNGSSDNNDDNDKEKPETSSAIGVHFPGDTKLSGDIQGIGRPCQKNAKIIFNKNIDTIQEECKSARTCLMKCDTFVNNNILDTNNFKVEGCVSYNFKDKNFNEKVSADDFCQSSRWKERERLPLEDMFRNEWVTNQTNSCRSHSGKFMFFFSTTKIQQP